VCAKADFICARIAPPAASRGAAAMAVAARVAPAVAAALVSDAVTPATLAATAACAERRTAGRAAALAAAAAALGAMRDDGAEGGRAALRPLAAALRSAAQAPHRRRLASPAAAGAAADARRAALAAAARVLRRGADASVVDGENDAESGMLLGALDFIAALQTFVADADDCGPDDVACVDPDDEEAALLAEGVVAAARSLLLWRLRRSGGGGASAARVRAAAAAALRLLLSRRRRRYGPLASAVWSAAAGELCTEAGAYCRDAADVAASPQAQPAEAALLTWRARDAALLALLALLREALPACGATSAASAAADVAPALLALARAAPPAVARPAARLLAAALAISAPGGPVCGPRLSPSPMLSAASDAAALAAHGPAGGPASAPLLDALLRFAGGAALAFTACDDSTAAAAITRKALLLPPSWAPPPQFATRPPRAAGAMGTAAPMAPGAAALPMASGRHLGAAAAAVAAREGAAAVRALLCASAAWRDAVLAQVGPACARVCGALNAPGGKQNDEAGAPLLQPDDVALALALLCAIGGADAAGATGCGARVRVCAAAAATPASRLCPPHSLAALDLEEAGADAVVVASAHAAGAATVALLRSRPVMHQDDCGLDDGSYGASRISADVTALREVDASRLRPAPPMPLGAEAGVAVAGVVAALVAAAFSAGARAPDALRSAAARAAAALLRSGGAGADALAAALRSPVAAENGATALLRFAAAPLPGDALWGLEQLAPRLACARAAALETALAGGLTVVTAPPQRAQRIRDSPAAPSAAAAAVRAMGAAAAKAVAEAEAAAQAASAPCVPALPSDADSEADSEEAGFVTPVAAGGSPPSSPPPPRSRRISQSSDAGAPTLRAPRLSQRVAAGEGGRPASDSDDSSSSSSSDDDDSVPGLPDSSSSGDSDDTDSDEERDDVFSRGARSARAARVSAPRASTAEPAALLGGSFQGAPFDEGGDGAAFFEGEAPLLAMRPPPRAGWPALAPASLADARPGAAIWLRGFSQSQGDGDNNVSCVRGRGVMLRAAAGRALLRFNDCEAGAAVAVWAPLARLARLAARGPCGADDCAEPAFGDADCDDDVAGPLLGGSAAAPWPLSTAAAAEAALCARDAAAALAAAWPAPLPSGFASACGGGAALAALITAVAADGAPRHELPRAAWPRGAAAEALPHLLRLAAAAARADADVAAALWARAVIVPFQAAADATWWPRGATRLEAPPIVESEAARRREPPPVRVGAPGAAAIALRFMSLGDGGGGAAPPPTRLAAHGASAFYDSAGLVAATAAGGGPTAAVAGCRAWARPPPRSAGLALEAIPLGARPAEGAAPPPPDAALAAAAALLDGGVAPTRPDATALAGALARYVAAPAAQPGPKPAAARLLARLLRAPLAARLEPDDAAALRRATEAAARLATRAPHSELLCALAEAAIAQALQTLGTNESTETSSEPAAASAGKEQSEEADDAPMALTVVSARYGQFGIAPPGSSWHDVTAAAASRVVGATLALRAGPAPLWRTLGLAEDPEKPASALGLRGAEAAAADNMPRGLLLEVQLRGAGSGAAPAAGAPRRLLLALREGARGGIMVTADPLAHGGRIGPACPVMMPAPAPPGATRATAGVNAGGSAAAAANVAASAVALAPGGLRANLAPGVGGVARLRADVAVFAGAWYYEVTIGVDNAMTFGWVDAAPPPAQHASPPPAPPGIAAAGGNAGADGGDDAFIVAAQDALAAVSAAAAALDARASPAVAAPGAVGSGGLGDDARSWGYDGYRKRVWHAGAFIRFGAPWRPGDVLGVGVDILPRGATAQVDGSDVFSRSADGAPILQPEFQLHYWLNGEALGLAARGTLPRGGLAPAASLAPGGVAEFNFGATPLAHGPPPGYRALALAPPRRADVAAPLPWVAAAARAVAAMEAMAASRPLPALLLRAAADLQPVQSCGDDLDDKDDVAYDDAAGCVVPYAAAARDRAVAAATAAAEAQAAGWCAADDAALRRCAAAAAAAAGGDVSEVGVEALCAAAASSSRHLAERFTPAALAGRLSLLRHISAAAAALAPLAPPPLAAGAPPPVAGSPAAALLLLREALLPSAWAGGAEAALAATTARDGRPSLALNRARAAAAAGEPGFARGAGPGGLFTQAHAALRSRPAAALRQADRAWTVLLEGEGAEDYGGPYAESMSAICAELQSNPEAGAMLHVASSLGASCDAEADVAAEAPPPVLVPTPNAAAGAGARRDAWLPGRAGGRCAAGRARLRTLGALLGVAFRTGAPVDLELPPLVWRALATPSSRDDADDFITSDADWAEIDAIGAAALSRLDAASDDAPAAERAALLDGLVWAAPRLDGTLGALRPGGAEAPVAWADRRAYVAAARAARAAELAPALAALRRGFAAVVPLRAAALLPPAELARRCCGAAAVDVAALRASATYAGCSASDAHICLFWAALEGFSQPQRRAFLRFAWGRARLPPPGAPGARHLELQAFGRTAAAATPNAFLPIGAFLACMSWFCMC
jgi:hypothetical protein